MKKKYDVRGMGCAACSARVEKCVGAINGVQKVEVNLLAASMVVNFDEKVCSSHDIVNTVEEAGYEAKEAEEEEGDRRSPSDIIREQAGEMKRRLITSIAFVIPLFYVAMSPVCGWPLPEIISQGAPYYLIEAMLTVPIVAAGNKFFTVGFGMLVHRNPNMDSLIAVGATAAILLGYFESAGMVLTLVTVGKYLEAVAKCRTGSAIEKLTEMVPDTATVIHSDAGEEKTVLVAEIEKGDMVIVKPGESIPVDGIIVSGTTTVDESALTGESIPLDKGEGDSVNSACINLSGRILVEATKVGDDTTLSEIIRLVDEAGSSKAPISRFADKVAAVFVPIVMVIAFAAAIIWIAVGMEIPKAVMIGISVLVVSCPCALGLATPVAIMTGTGRGAQSGILVKSAAVLEKLRDVEIVVLDKTGTITEGNPKVTDIEGLEPSLAASIEKYSTHPLAKAIVAFASGEDDNVEKFASEKDSAGKETSSKSTMLECDDRRAENYIETPGRGVSTSIDGKDYIAGNAALMEEQGVDIDRDRGLELAAAGKTVVYFAENGKYKGLVALRDEPKPTSSNAVRAIEAMGIDVVMLTGDNNETAQAIRKNVGIDKVYAQVLPQDKEKVIAELISEGRTVAMVGDGVNDAPAITRADVGIAIGSGTDIAIESADIVLVKDDLRDVVKSIKLSSKVVANIKQNLFWALCYNAVCIPVAAGVLYPFTGILLNPMICAACMSISSVCVVLNALRIKRAKL